MIVYQKAYFLALGNRDEVPDTGSDVGRVENLHSETHKGQKAQVVDFCHHEMVLNPLKHFLHSGNANHEKDGPLFYGIWESVNNEYGDQCYKINPELLLEVVDSHPDFILDPNTLRVVPGYKIEEDVEGEDHDRRSLKKRYGEGVPRKVWEA